MFARPLGELMKPTPTGMTDVAFLRFRLAGAIRCCRQWYQEVQIDDEVIAAQEIEISRLIAEQKP